MANPKYDGSDSGPIDLSTARKWVQNFKTAHPDPKEIRSHYFGRWIIDKILRQPGCTGLRIYYALNDEGAKELIISGVDGQGGTMNPQSLTLSGDDPNTLADASFPCPPICNPSGEL